MNDDQVYVTQDGMPTAFFVTAGEDRQEFVSDGKGYAHSRRDIEELISICENHLRIFESEDDVRRCNAKWDRARADSREERNATASAIRDAKRGRKSKRPTFIYLCRNKRNGLTKIGLSAQPSVREKTLQSEEPELEFILVRPGDSTTEELLHIEFASKRTRGEWFDLSDDDIGIITRRLK